MSADTDALRDLYLDVTGTETVTETQAEEPSRDPIEGPEAEVGTTVSDVVRQDGLEDAVAGAEVES